MRKRILTLLAVLMLSGMLSGCGLIDYYFLPPPEDTAQELYEAGADSMASKDYAKAAVYFQKLKDRYPFSPYTSRAELGLADAYFLNEDYLIAMDNYKEFEALHPRDEQIGYVLLQIGKSALLSYQYIDKPPSALIEGMEYLFRLKDILPGTEYAQQAEEYITKTRHRLAEHELFVADTYWRTDRFGAAWKRYGFVAHNFSDLEDIYAYASRRAEMSYLRMQEETARDKRDEAEGSWKDYFDWL